MKITRNDVERLKDDAPSTNYFLTVAGVVFFIAWVLWRAQ